MNGGITCFFDILTQLIDLNHGWFFISYIPLYPSRLYLFLFKSLFTKSTQCGLHPGGNYLSLILA